MYSTLLTSDLDVLKGYAEDAIKSKFRATGLIYLMEECLKEAQDLSLDPAFIVEMKGDIKDAKGELVDVWATDAHERHAIGNY